MPHVQAFVTTYVVYCRPCSAGEYSCLCKSCAGDIMWLAPGFVVVYPDAKFTPAHLCGNIACMLHVHMLTCTGASWKVSSRICTFAHDSSEGSSKHNWLFRRPATQVDGNFRSVHSSKLALHLQNERISLFNAPYVTKIKTHSGRTSLCLTSFMSLSLYGASPCQPVFYIVSLLSIGKVKGPTCILKLLTVSIKDSIGCACTSCEIRFCTFAVEVVIVAWIAKPCKYTCQLSLQADIFSYWHSWRNQQRYQ